MKYGAIGVGLFVLSLISAAQATTWTSPDGKLSFDIAANGSLPEVKNPPAPASAMWQAADGARLIYLTQPHPENTPLYLAALEEGTLKPLQGGSILSSSETRLAGVPVFTIAATNNQGIYLQQVVICFSGNVYKVMAGGSKQISADSRFTGVFNSVKILDPNPIVPARKLSINELSVKAAEIGMGALLIGGIVWVIVRAARFIGAASASAFLSLKQR